MNKPSKLDIIIKMIMVALLIVMLYTVYYNIPILPHWLYIGLIYFYAMVGWIMGVVSVIMLIALSLRSDSREIWKSINDEFISKSTLYIIYVSAVSISSSIVLFMVGFNISGWVYITGIIYYIFAGTLSQYKI